MFAWVLSDVVKYKEALPYEKHQGAVIRVKLCRAAGVMPSAKPQAEAVNGKVTKADAEVKDHQPARCRRLSARERSEHTTGHYARALRGTAGAACEEWRGRAGTLQQRAHVSASCAVSSNDGVASDVGH